MRFKQSQKYTMPPSSTVQAPKFNLIQNEYNLSLVDMYKKLKEKEGDVPEKELSIDSESKEDEESERSLEIVLDKIKF